MRSRRRRRRSGHNVPEWHGWHRAVGGRRWQYVRVRKQRADHRKDEARIDAVARLQYYMDPQSAQAVDAADAEVPDPSPAQSPDDSPEEQAVPSEQPEQPEQAEWQEHSEQPEELRQPDRADPPEQPEPEALPQPVEAIAMTSDEQTGGVRAELDKAPSEVAAMFDRVAQRYDLVNDLLALGQTRIWRSLTLRAVAPEAGERILDLAAGTGTSSAPFAEHGAEVVPCDFSLGMLEVGKRRQPSLPFVAGDAMNLPFQDGVFDAVTISFGLRNVQDTTRALREMLRVTKPGGRLVICEFSAPTNRLLRKVYMEYLVKALPAIARRTASNPAAYVYLAESIAAWPDQRQLAEIIADAGWARPQWRNATGGIVAIHRAYKPA